MDEKADLIDGGDRTNLKAKTLLIACGALGREIVDTIAANHWTHLDIKCLPAALHHTPAKIPEAVRTKIIAHRSDYSEIYVLYGDCGTGGALDKVLQEEGNIERIGGPHCFSFYLGNAAFAQTHEDGITTFYLTDFFCRHFDRFVWKAFALDRHPDMLSFVFGNYTKLIFMPQVKDDELERKAQRIAIQMGLQYEYRFAGYGDFGAFLNKKSDSGPLNSD